MRIWGLLLIIGLFSSSLAFSDSVSVAQSIFQHLTGALLDRNDPRLRQMTELVTRGDRRSAAHIAIEDDLFYEVNLRAWAAEMTASNEDPRTPLNDMQALVFGVARDGLDARLLLTGNLTYGMDQRFNLGPPRPDSNQIYDSIRLRDYKLRTTLQKIEPQWENPNLPASGLLTTRGWAEAYYSGGTNRRAVEAMFRIFMCAPSLSWRYAGLPESRIRRDVDRRPGGNPEAFQRECRSCHAPMDALAGAFSKVDFVGGAFIHSSRTIVAKYNQNGSVYPEGYQTSDDSWINWISQGQNRRFGWRSVLEGQGIPALGAMFAASDGFKSCMVKRVYSRVCRQELNPETQVGLAEELEKDFVANRYSIKELFAAVAGKPECLPE